MNAVELHEVTKSFGAIRAVRSLSLTIGKGEMVALVGPDGAGKTTTIRMLCGITQPDAGSLSVLGFDLRTQTAEVKRRIGYLSQKFSLYGDLTVDENIEFFAEIHGVRDYRPRREELLEFTRLTPFRARLAEKLSGGMKQKLALACTLIHTPEVIFLDEPTTGVDPVSRRDFWKILASLLKEGITIVMTTPYLDEAERCHRVALMNEGAIMVADTPANLKRLLNGTLIEVVCSELRRAVAVLKDFPLTREVQAFGDRLNAIVDDSKRDMPKVLHHLKSQAIQVEDWRVVTPSLENIFISLLTEHHVSESEGV
ncbi:MAG: multidrug ABC transporter ATP-binding protein [Ignavibacteria bacterium GWA2_55_25]|nr:MAG: multidrug ABC transporter ATP-binding protein [Ignavibacteria bacterium GWA2_55_25]